MTTSRSHHLVDPELAAALEEFPSFEMNAETLAMVRSMFGSVDTPADDGIARSELWIPGPAGAPPVRVLLYRRQDSGDTLPAVLNIHGGGYVIGTPEMEDANSSAMCAQLGCVVVSVDYRLAPEHAFPAAIEDCYAALLWMHAQAAELRLDRSRIAVVGGSAGGGLAAALALLARDRGEVPLCFQQLIFPMIDDRTGSTSEPHPYAGEFMWTPASNRYGWESLLGAAPGGANVSPYAAAARAENLAGLPPAFISVGALDLFVDENLEYARRLIHAGVPTELHVYPGAYHGFQMTAQAQVTRASNSDAMQALRRAFG